MVVVDGRSGGMNGLKWKDIEPPLHDSFGFTEKTMAAKIQAVTLVIDGPG